MGDESERDIAFDFGGLDHGPATALVFNMIRGGSQSGLVIPGAA